MSRIPYLRREELGLSPLGAKLRFGTSIERRLSEIAMPYGPACSR